MRDARTQSPIGRWRGYCLAVASCAYVCAVLRESEDDMIFAEMSEAAAAAAAAVLGADGEVRGPRGMSLVKGGRANGLLVF